MANQKLKDVIKDRYGKIARGEADFLLPHLRADYDRPMPGRGLYRRGSAVWSPKWPILGVGCGNPTALADLKDGETVLDLGSGAGIDVFLAAKRWGSTAGLSAWT